MLERLWSKGPPLHCGGECKLVSISTSQAQEVLVGGTYNQAH